MQTIYIGTNMRKFDLRKNRIYSDRPEKLIQNVEQAGYPLVGKLFVSVDDLNKSQNEINTQGTPIFLANEQIKAVK